MTNYIDFVYAIRILTLLTTSWEDFEAYKLGLIDAEGKLLKPVAKMSSSEKEAYTYFYRLIFNLKRILGKVPFGKTKLASYAAALYLIKEHINNDSEFETFMKEFVDYTNKNDMNPDKITYQTLKESVLNKSPEIQEDIANTSGGENIATHSKPMAYFANHPVFTVDGSTYDKCIHGKKQYARWAKYVDCESYLGQGIKEFAKKNPKSKIILKDEKYGSMIYLKR